MLSAPLSSRRALCVCGAGRQFAVAQHEALQRKHGKDVVIATVEGSDVFLRYKHGPDHKVGRRMRVHVHVPARVLEHAPECACRLSRAWNRWRST